jgi:hypothetical protein
MREEGSCITQKRAANLLSHLATGCTRIGNLKALEPSKLNYVAIACADHGCLDGLRWIDETATQRWKRSDLDTAEQIANDPAAGIMKSVDRVKARNTGKQSQQRKRCGTITAVTHANWIQTM